MPDTPLNAIKTGARWRVIWQWLEAILVPKPRSP